MGAGASIGGFKHLTKEDIANHIKATPKVEQCAAIFLENEVDGAMLTEIRDADLNDFLTELGIKSVIQRTRLLVELKKIKGSKDLDSQLESSTTNGGATVEDKFEASFMVFGDDGDFKDGLTKKIGFLERSMEEECLTNDGGKWANDYRYIVEESAGTIRERRWQLEL